MKYKLTSKASYKYSHLYLFAATKKSEKIFSLIFSDFYNFKISNLANTLYLAH